MKNTIQKGFSLLELLIYIALSTIILLTIVNIFILFEQGRGKVESRAEVNEQLRFTTEKITQDIGSASVLVTPATLGQTTSTLTITVLGENITYCLIDGTLYREPAGGSCTASSPAITSENVTVESINFTRMVNTNTILSKSTISVILNISMQYKSNSPQWQYSGSQKTTISLP